MKCEECKGVGEQWIGPRCWPCEACGGTGIQHCCEGLRADPVVDGDWAAPSNHIKMPQCDMKISFDGDDQ